MAELLITVGVSYLLGSIPFGYLLVRLLRGQDIRDSGSGNIGATNVARSSPALGALTLLLDAAKGLAAVALARRLFDDPSVPLAAIAALAAIIGHIFPVWLRFRGGKGVATGLGAFSILAPRAMLASVAVFLLVALLFHRVSLASISAVAVFPFFAWALNEFEDQPVALLLMGTASLLIVLKHRENIRRLLAGSEPVFSLRRR